jgi:hypothetical protein
VTPSIPGAPSFLLAISYAARRVSILQTWTYSPQNRQDGSAFALKYILRLRSCKSSDAFVILVLAFPLFSLILASTRSVASLPRHGLPNATASSVISIMERMHAMTRKTGKMPALTPHEKRLRNTDRKLREALERLVKGLPHTRTCKSDPTV